MTTPVPITLAYGDGIGPEIMRATLRIIEAAGAQLECETIEIGEKMYAKGHNAGIAPEAWESLRRTKVVLKAPITTPQGGGFKSLNVTIRKALGLFANVRPCRSYAPFVSTKHPVMDVVIVRENEEDLYAGIEHRQSEEVYQCLKIITRPGCERIVRYAFEYARANARAKVTCFTKDNIMKLTDGLFHKVFDEIGAEYPEIEKEHWIVDIGAAKMADTPEAFDVIVMPNLYGDILSDVAAQIAGSVGLAGSANIGEVCSMFEAIHGSAPRRAGQNVANPSGLFLASVMMLNHIGQSEVAERAHNAWLRTLEDGIHTYDIFRAGVSKQQVSTSGFTDAVIERLGQLPQTLKPVAYRGTKPMAVPRAAPTRRQKIVQIGVDVFCYLPAANGAAMAARLKALEGDGWRLQVISNRGQMVWPDGFPETFCSDVFRCRYMAPDGASPLSSETVAALLARAAAAGIDVVKMETLRTFDGERGFSQIQGA